MGVGIREAKEKQSHIGQYVYREDHLANSRWCTTNKVIDPSLIPFLDASSHLYKRVCPSVRPLVLPLRKCKNHVSWLFLATVRSYNETNDQPTCFESLLYSLLSHFTRLFVHLSLHICHMINTCRDTAWTHRCPVGLVEVLCVRLSMSR